MFGKYYILTFPQTWKKPRWILVKACLTAKNFILVYENIFGSTKEILFLRNLMKVLPSMTLIILKMPKK